MFEADGKSYSFKLPPYKHQMDALKASVFSEEYALFCEMGTGKSKILLDTVGVLLTNGDITGAIIVAPKGVYKNWQMMELPKHLPDSILEKTDVITWSASQSVTQKKLLEQGLRTDGRYKILIINVEAFSSERGSSYALRFATTHKCLMAVDESTTIKNRSAARTKSIIKVGSYAKYRRIMTGSPVTKSPMDLFSQCSFLSPSLLGHSSFYTFQNRYAKMIRRSVGSHSFNQVVGYQNLDELSDKLDRFSFRVLKKDCLDLPEKIYLKRTVEMTDEQAVAYGTMKRHAMSILSDGKETVSAKSVLTQLLRLQQICAGSVTSDGGTVTEIPSNKMTELLNVLEEVDGKVIIWATFVHDIKRITSELNDQFGAGSAASYFGDTSADDRQMIVDMFQNPDSKLRFFVGNPRTGGYGLTLTEAKTVIYYNNIFDLEVRLQSEDRAHRIGQRNNVTYIDLVTENTVEEKILKALRDKIDIATLVLKEEYKEWLV